MLQMHVVRISREDVEQNAVFAKHAVKLSLQNVAAAQMYPPAEKVFESLHVNVCM